MEQDKLVMLGVGDYSKINFHELRLYARQIGVKKPTTYNKKELIEKIKQIEKGQVAPVVEKRGRPIKQSLFAKQKEFSSNKREIMFEIRQVIGIMEDLYDKVAKLKED